MQQHSQGLVTRAHRRAALVAVLHGAAIGGTVGSAFALVLLLAAWMIDQLAAALRAPLAIALGVVSLSLILGAMAGFRGRSTRLDVAVRLDRAMGLRDRLGTAESLRAPSGRAAPDSAAVALVLADAERHSLGLNGRAAIPFRGGGWWLGATLLVAMALTVGSMIPLPSAAVTALSDDGTDAPDATRETTRAGVERALTELRREQALPPEIDAGAVARLDAIAEQLAQPDQSVEQLAAAREQATASLSELSDELTRAAQRERAALDEIASEFSQIAGQHPTPGAVQPFAEALRDGRLDDAADALTELLTRVDEMTPDDRAALAEYFDRMRSAQRDRGPALEATQRETDATPTDSDGSGDGTRVPEPTPSPAPEPPVTPGEAERPPTDGERDADRTGEQAPPESTPARGEPAEAERPHDAPRIDEPSTDSTGSAPSDERDADRPDADSRSAEERAVAEPSADPDAEQDGRRQALEEALREMADRVREPTPPSDAGTADAPRPDDDPVGERPRPAAEESPARVPGEQPRSGSDQGAEQPSERPNQQPNQQPDQQPDQQRPDGSPAQGRDRSPTGSSGQSGDAESREPGGAKPQRPSSEPGTGEQSSDPAAPDAATRPESNRPSGDESARERRVGDPDGADDSPALERMLREMAEGQRDADDRLDQARRLRQEAERIAEGTTPQDQERLRRWSELAERESRPGLGNDATPPTPSDRPRAAPRDASGEDLDLTEPGAAGSVLAELLAESLGEDAADSGGSALPAPAARRIREAVERGVDPTDLPSRYHRLMRRYFGRLPDTAANAREQAERRTPNPAPAPAPGNAPDPTP